MIGSFRLRGQRLLVCYLLSAVLVVFATGSAAQAAVDKKVSKQLNGVSLKQWRQNQVAHLLVDGLGSGAIAVVKTGTKRSQAFSRDRVNRYDAKKYTDLQPRDFRFYDRSGSKRVKLLGSSWSELSSREDVYTVVRRLGVPSRQAVAAMKIAAGSASSVDFSFKVKITVSVQLRKEFSRELRALAKEYRELADFLDDFVEDVETDPSKTSVDEFADRLFEIRNGDDSYRKLHQYIEGVYDALSEARTQFQVLVSASRDHPVLRRVYHLQDLKRFQDALTTLADEYTEYAQWSVKIVQIGEKVQQTRSNPLETLTAIDSSSKLNKALISRVADELGLDVKLVELYAYYLDAFDERSVRTVGAYVKRGLREIQLDVFKGISNFES